MVPAESIQVPLRKSKCNIPDGISFMILPSDVVNNDPMINHTQIDVELLS